MPFSTDDTIVAIATPEGRGGIGVVRISGPGAVAIAGRLTGNHRLEPRHATFARVQGAEVSDQAVVTWFQAPASYTGEDVVEISAHGSPVLLRSIVEGAIGAGARLAEPGEFTLRSFLSGRIDLVQSEAVGDLVDAVTPLQARAAFDQLEGTLTERIRDFDRVLFDLSTRLEASLDFAGEGYHFIEPGHVGEEIGNLLEALEELLGAARAGRLVREGATVVIIGPPNAGKSSLFNALAGAARAIVTDIAGTTRDLLTETVDVRGIAVTLVDTAGIRGVSADAIEIEGIARARLAAGRADLLLVVIDRSQPLSSDDWQLIRHAQTGASVLVASKSDLPEASWPAAVAAEALAVSVRSGTGLDEVRSAIAERLGARDLYRDPPAITNVRHVALLRTASEALQRARAAADRLLPEEFIAADIQAARTALEEITGRRVVDDTLEAIFARFCIGK